MSTGVRHHQGLEPDQAGPPSPFQVTVDPIASMLNFELADHPVYEGGELQWFDDDAHGTGMLALLSRRADRRVDYYPQHGLSLDRGGYELGGGTGSWTDTGFEAGRLEVHADGVRAEARFTDVDGRLIEVRVDDRDGRPRRRGALLAPVSAAVDRPTSLLLVWMPAFDLVRVTGVPPIIRVEGRDAATGRLPGARLHRRHLIKYAAPVVAVQVNRTSDVPLRLGSGPPPAVIDAEQAGHRARLAFAPGPPDVAALPRGSAAAGRWHLEVDGARLTGGTWSASHTGRRVLLGLDVRERWRPGRLPWLMHLVTTVAPVFRRWPTTYRWRAEVELDPAPVMTARWERTATDRGRTYRRITHSSTPRGQ